MYKLLLCWRYLRTRWIALASIVSVTLGVATMIVVNSVMEGFSHEMQSRLHQILSDIVFEAHDLKGFPDPEWHMQQIREVGGDDIVGTTATVAVPAMLSFQYGGNWVTRPVQLVGIDQATVNQAGDFAQFLQHPGNQADLSFQLRESGYDARTSIAPGARRPMLAEAGWGHRRQVAERVRWQREAQQRRDQVQPVGVVAPGNDAATVNDPTSASKTAPPNDVFDQPTAPANPFLVSEPKEDEATFDMAREQHTGLVLGIALASYRDHEGGERFLVVPGDDVKLTFPTAGTPPRAIDDTFTIVDFYECKMSEYDASFVFVPIHRLQELRGMLDPASGVRFATSIQIRLRPEANAAAVRDRLRRHFPPELFSISTWRDKQGALLAAVAMETAILNVLLFLIIAVAGFGILAIFYMIVVEKTRDIGILKSLGASGRGIMGIFLGYGLSLGAVGAGVGMVLGLLFVWNINKIAHVLSLITGREVFDPSIYYFYQIPTIVEPWTIAWIVGGALAIAVLASVLPARRAAGLHPVEALRYE